mgnify:CR=1 FL=1
MLALAPAAQSPYTAEKASVDGVEVVRLADLARGIEVSVAPSLGNMACEMKAHGKNVLWMPRALGDFKTRPGLAGVPFLAPWANRIDGWAYYANGKQYLLNRELKNAGPDQNGNPMHGLLGTSPLWRVVELGAGAADAHVTSRLEFWKHPDLMAQFPFAHTIEMTYRLAGGALEVETRLLNHSSQPMPVAIGFHPYFRLYDSPRDEWKIRIPAREQMVLSEKLIPTGETKPNPYAETLPLAGVRLDDVFSGLLRDAGGRATFRVEGHGESISVAFGPKYRIGVVYAPPRGGFVCFEPMSAPTNAFNMTQAGTYKEMDSIPPGGEWKESFWIRPEGF